MKFKANNILIESKSEKTLDKLDDEEIHWVGGFC